jgi:HK97 gp10 family phage protein
MAKGDFNTLSMGLEELGLMAEDWSRNMRKNLVQAMHQIGQAWAAEAKRRCPVENGTLRNSISYNVIDGTLGVWLDVGVPNEMHYAIYVEFGTRFIAKGAVLALGPDPGITDAQAIKDWPAKAANANASTYGSGEEQMPWLRTAYNAIADRAEDLIYHAVGYEV